MTGVLVLFWVDPSDVPISSLVKCALSYRTGSPRRGSGQALAHLLLYCVLPRCAKIILC